MYSINKEYRNLYSFDYFQKEKTAVLNNDTQSQKGKLTL